MPTVTSSPSSAIVVAPVPPVPPALPPPPAAPSIGGCGLPGIRFQESFLWNFFITNLNSEIMTMLDRVASNRSITFSANDATEISFRVPADDKRVNIPFVDGDPKVDEGTRLLVGFRREGSGSWICRATGLIMQARDSVENDAPYSDFTAWDPWRYLDFLPVYNWTQESLKVPTPGPVYELIGYPIQPQTGQPNYNLPYTNTVDSIILDQLNWATIKYNDFFIDYGQLNAPGSMTTADVIPLGPVPLPHPYGIQNGASIGQMLRELSQDIANGGRGYCDITLTPIYDPVNRPGILAELRIYPKGPLGLGSGTARPNIVFGWDKIPNNITSVDRQKDGTQRSNSVLMYQSRGGPPVSLKSDPTSQLKYRRYHRASYFPTQGGRVKTIEDLAVAQLLLRANGVKTLTISPAPDRAQVPLRDYNIHDIVGVNISKRLREETFEAYQIQQIPLVISDEALESVSSLTLKKVALSSLYGPFAGPVVNLRDNGDANRARERSSQTSLPGP